MPRKTLQRNLFKCLLVVFVSCSSVKANDYHPNFHPGLLKGPDAAKPNEVMVLGSLHLSSLSSILRAPMLAPLLNRLEGWRPGAIATESLSGLQCQAMRDDPARYEETVHRYCMDPTHASQTTKLNVYAANTEAERLLHSWSSTPSAGERRHLAAVFLAAGEPGSAMVQWLRLGADEQHPGDGLDEALIALLKAKERSFNETYSVGAEVAVRVGLERLWSIDDHTAAMDDGPDPVEEAAYEKALKKAWDNPATKKRQAEEGRAGLELKRPDGILAVYRTLNAPPAAMDVYRSDFGAALGEASPQQFGRHYVGYWETRNLRMVSNIRAVLGRSPGTRMLVIVGASHKGYCEAYLDQMHDVILANPLTLLQ